MDSAAERPGAGPPGGDHPTGQPGDDDSAGLLRGRGTVGAADSDTIGQRLDELAGEHSDPELALVHRLITSFLARAPRHLIAIDEALGAGDAETVAEQAHSLRGAAGNIGAATVMRVCASIEDTARSGRLPDSLAADLRELRDELDRAEHRLREAAST